MKNIPKYDVIIIGGGLAGLTNAIHLSKFKQQVLLIEKKSYPRHRVCGEYISNEVLPYLNSLGIDPIKEGAKQISKVEVSTSKGNLIKGELPLGGFGMSRYFLDNLLLKKAQSNGVVVLKDSVDSVVFKNQVFTVQTKDSKSFQSKITIGAFGKRSELDMKMNRKFIKKKYKVIVVSSAMSGVTNQLLLKTKKTSKNFPNDEKDVILSTGEQISCALIAGKLNELGFKSRSWLGWQLPILTKGNHCASRIFKIKKNKLLSYLKSGGIPIVTGFQGVNSDFRITTLERGGSDTSAILCAKFFKAKKCIIYTDVEGVYTTDPNLINAAKKIDKISYEEMLEMASLGAKVMQPASIQEARLNRIEIDVRSTFSNTAGTTITKKKKIF